ncbi:MAG: glycoside hydrolase family 15 protein [Chthonomonadaceae bacterium]|nr:glycoside hydrolase family 15 protein [Chthonomonadaceae bacterium]
MPRPLTFGNSSVHVGIDDRCQIRDLHAAPPGGHLENHLNGHPIRLGFWTPGGFAWTTDPRWVITMGREGPMGTTRLRHEGLGIDVAVRDTLRGSVLTRRFEFAKGGEVRLFTSHDLRLSESDVGDTALYHAGLDALVHYKGRIWVGFAARSAGGGLAGFATGLKAFDGHEGTWRDAEDGLLEGKPISQGSVDSTLMVRLESAEGQWVEWKMAVAHSQSELEELLADLPPTNDRRPTTHTLFDASLDQIEAHTHGRGAILAAMDSDIMATNRATYTYVWPRDGALVAWALDRAGRHEQARGFFEFAASLVESDGPRLFQKYHTDGSLGASWHPWTKGARPHQGDQLPLVLHALALHPSPVWHEATVRKAAEFLVKDRDARTGLPLPSYDLWEERLGTHTFTVAAAIAGLRGAARLLGDSGFDAAADEMTASLEQHLVNRDTGTLLRGLDTRGTPDATPDASLLLVPLLGVLPFEHPAIAATVPWLEERLWVHSEVGGLARYPGDYYFRRSDAYPGNPWVITTLWLARCLCRLPGRFSRAEQLVGWAAARASDTCTLPEQVHPESGEVMGVSPLTWSHAEFVHATLDLRLAPSDA